MSAHCVEEPEAEQARVSQQFKHAEFRQTWIDAMRADMARFQLLAAQNQTDTGTFADRRRWPLA